MGYGLFEAGASGYGEMRPDNTGDDGSKKTIPDFKRGYIDITISGGTIGNDREYKYYAFDIDTKGKTAAEIEDTRFSF